MTFGETAVATCVAAMRERKIAQRHINDILRCRAVDVSPVEQFLTDEDFDVRFAAIHIVGEKGNAELLVEVVKRETDNGILFDAMRLLGRKCKKLEELIYLLESENTLIRDEAVAMFRAAGREDLLFSLVFSPNENVVAQVKDYINERDADSTKPDASQ